jgi:hypothetical protein
MSDNKSNKTNLNKTDVNKTNLGKPNNDPIVKNDEEKTIELLHKYDRLISLIDNKNMLYYGALFRQLYKDFKLEEDDQGTVNKSIDELSKILEKACSKLNFDIHNANVKQIIKLFNILIEKIGGSTTLRGYDECLETLMYRMYSDDELIDILLELEEDKINPENIIGLNKDDQIVFSNKKVRKLEPSSKHDELISYLSELNKKN